jgi:hypothetical protein
MINNTINKMKHNTKIRHCPKMSKIDKIIVGRGKIDTTNIQIHDRSLSELATDTSIMVAGLS